MSPHVHSNGESAQGESHWAHPCVADGQGHRQFSRYHRGLTVLLGGCLVSGPDQTPSQVDPQVALLSRCVTELVNRPRCQRGSDGFDPHTHRHSSPCSSVEEHDATNVEVVGSSPSRGSTYARRPRSSVEEHRAPNAEARGSSPLEGSMMRDSSVVERLAHNQDAVGSIPTPATNRLAVLAPVALCCQPSIPGGARVAEHSTDNREVPGSSPGAWTNHEVGGGEVDGQGPPPRRPEEDARVAQLVESASPTNWMSGVRFPPCAPIEVCDEPA